MLKSAGKKHGTTIEGHVGEMVLATIIGHCQA